MVSYSAVLLKDLVGGFEYTSDSFPDTFQTEGQGETNRALHRTEYILDMNTYPPNTYKINVNQTPAALTVW